MKRPNGALIKTEKPCDYCEGKHLAAMGRCKPIYVLRAYNGNEICDNCAAKVGLLGFKSMNNKH